MNAVAWIVVIVVALLIVGAIVSASKRTGEASKQQTFDIAAASRAEAYAAYLRRTSASPDMTDVSDAELQDKLRAGVREYNAEAKSINNGGGFIWVIGIGISAVMLYGSSNGTSGSAIVVIIFVMIITSAVHAKLKERMIRNLDEKFRQRGLDPQQLKVGD